MATHRCRLQLLLLLLGILLVIPGSLSEYVRVFRILEGVPAGTRIGYIGEAEVGFIWMSILLIWMSILMMWRMESERMWEAGDG